MKETLRSKSPQSHGILARPFSRSGLVLGSVSFVELSNFGDERIIRIWVSQQRAHRQQHLRDCQRRAPLVLQNVQADVAVGVDVGMVDAAVGCEGDFGWFEGVIRGESDAEEEDAASVRAIRRSHDGSLPIVH